MHSVILTLRTGLSGESAVDSLSGAVALAVCARLGGGV